MVVLCIQYTTDDIETSMTNLERSDTPPASSKLQAGRNENAAAYNVQPTGPILEMLPCSNRYAAGIITSFGKTHNITFIKGATR